jgi:hypothetical protein
MRGRRLNGQGIWVSNGDADLVKLTFHRLRLVFHVLLLYIYIYI